MDGLELQNLKENTIEALFDANSVMCRHLPSQERLGLAVNLLYKNKPDATISSLTKKDYEALFKFMRMREDKTIPEYLIPKGTDLENTVQVFKDLAKENNRENAKIDTEDLEVLCITYNTLRFQQNRNLYLERFSKEI